MKSKLLLLMAFALMVGQVDAQSQLKMLGKAAANRTKSEVKSEPQTQVVKKSPTAEQQQPRVQQQTRVQQPQVQQTQPVQQQAQAQQQPKERPVSVHAQYTQDNPPKSLYSNISICHKVLVEDVGQNIVQQPGLDYIDEYGINHGGGILISGILWAPVNCGYHATKFPYGKLYQWGRKHGQGYGEPYAYEGANVNPDAQLIEIVEAPVTPAEARKYPNRFYAGSAKSRFSWTINYSMLWNTSTEEGIISKNVENDPCPKGWRVPDIQDFNILRLNYSETTTKDGQKGHWCSGTEPYSTEAQRIFLPYAGWRNPDGGAGSRDTTGQYWSGRPGCHFNLRRDVKIDTRAWPHEAYSVRCVKDIKGQRLR